MSATFNTYLDIFLSKKAKACNINTFTLLPLLTFVNNIIHVVFLYEKICKKSGIM